MSGHLRWRVLKHLPGFDIESKLIPLVYADHSPAGRPWARGAPSTPPPPPLEGQHVPFVQNKKPGEAQGQSYCPFVCMQAFCSFPVRQIDHGEGVSHMRDAARELMDRLAWPL